jgi:tetratricopeptide (TPR) repeat protein
MLLKDALRRLLDNKEADVTDIGKKLVEKYPQDINAYYSLNMFQSVIKDYEGAVKTLKSGLKIAERPGPVYNMLGYTYLSLNDTENAAAAFDKYIEMEPDNPTTYDSKGDYYMAVKDYTRAYESFMKANEIDSSWGMGKALKAKALSDSLLKK